MEAITNHREYLSAHYLAEVLPGSLKKGLLADWTAREKKGETTPRQGLRGLRQAYFATKSDFVDSDDQSRIALTRKLHQEILTALGFDPENMASGHLTIVEGHWTTEADAASDASDAEEGADGPGASMAGRLLEPVEIEPRVVIDSCFAYASHLFAVDEPPRYILVLNGAVLVLADRFTWGEGRYLAANLDVAFGRNDTSAGGEMDVVAALFGADALLPPQEGGDPRLATLVGESRQHAVGVSSELRDGLRLSVELIANEVLSRLREQRINPVEVVEPRKLTRHALRYLYRILFLLYAEARPELGVLPSDDPDYASGYSMARLGELAWRPLGGEQARQGFHLYESLDLLFRVVNGGHNPRGSQPIAEKASEGKGLRFEGMRSDLFAPNAIGYIGKSVDAFDGADTRLRNATLYHVLRLLMLTSAKRKSRGRGKKLERGGFISYAQLGINQLGAVYEGLMSYTGFIAAEELYEVAKGGDPKDGSWMIPASKVDEYPEEVFVTRQDEYTGVKQRVKYDSGQFVYRLAGRDRQISASYYTPQSLTEVTVQLALKYRLDQDGTKTPARELLDWSICEPALGSGAFLNEAINQVAAEYLRRRQDELETRIDPDQYATELQKVKTYIALHNSYGVDLNATAVELAEVSIWLNVMHAGLQAPWFGLHLRRGNSLIGGRRQYYLPKQVKDKSWLTAAPTDQPLRTGAWPDGGIHHFLLPADGWGAVAGEKEAKNLAPDDAKRLNEWRKKIKAGADDKQLKRLQAVAQRVETLWRLVKRRLELSEQAIRRDVQLWGADDLPPADKGADRAQIKDDLEAVGGPYWRLKTLMDTWCALWFWPLDKADRLDGSNEVYQRTQWTVSEQNSGAGATTIAEEQYEHTPLEFGAGFDEETSGALPAMKKGGRTIGRKATAAADTGKRVSLASLEDWLTFAEAIIGRVDLPAGSLVGHTDSLHDLDVLEGNLPQLMGADGPHLLDYRFPWLDTAQAVAKDQGFFHWEVELAQAFAQGGFDLQVGNPPWVRPRWEEDTMLAELDPWFALTENPAPAERLRRRQGTAGATSLLSLELTVNAGQVAYYSGAATYPLLTGTQPDLYRAFASRVWASLAQVGTAGLIHPDSHFGGAREGRLREAAYRHLRLHGHFQNMRMIFPELNSRQEFGVHIYGQPRDAISFRHASWLYSTETLVDSLTHDGTGPLPGVKLGGTWDLRPHKGRLVDVNDAVLAEWRTVTGDVETLIPQTKLLQLVTSAEQSAISALAKVSNRLGQHHPLISRGFDEKGAKNNGTIVERGWDSRDWTEVILQGPHFGVATPFAKQPNIPCRSNKDYEQWDLTTLPPDAVPRTSYRRAVDRSEFAKAQDLWRGRPYTDYFRLTWREMVPLQNERSLFACIVPPGPTHIHALRSMALGDNRETALHAAFWCSLPLDYLLRIMGRGHLDVNDAAAMPAPDGSHPLAKSALLRVLRLNCLTAAYAMLWRELFDADWRLEDWANPWPAIPEMLGDVSTTWTPSTPLRAERARRAALVELDALTAVWLGIGVEELVSMYQARFAVLNEYESAMWFDASGRRLARDYFARGVKQDGGAFDELMAHLDDPGTVPPPAGYTAPFFKADREGEYRQAHAVFSARLEAAKAAGWKPSTPDGAA